MFTATNSSVTSNQMYSNMSSYGSSNNATETRVLATRAFKGLVLVAVCWLAGNWNLSFAWLLFGLFTYLVWYKSRTEQRHRLPSAGMASEMALSMPSWVNFPDKERAEWLNKLTAQLWPFLDSYLSRLVDDHPKDIEEALPKYLKSFRIVKSNLGSIPFHISSVKCYDSAARDEIMMDIDINYSGNCEFEARVRGLKAGIKNIQISGVLRVELKPLLRELPIIGGVNVYFLTQPAMDFELTDIVEFMELPGLSDLLRRAILDQLSAYMVIPSKISVPLSGDISRKQLRFFEPMGVLRFELFEGRKLKRSDGIFGFVRKADPYCNVVIQGKTYQTRVVKGKTSPKWDFAVEALVYSVRGQRIVVEVMDEDVATHDDYLGRASIPLEVVISAGQVGNWIDLVETETGAIRFQASWLALSDEASAMVKHFQFLEFFYKRYPRSDEQTAPFGSVGVICVYVESIAGLPDNEEGQLPSTYVLVRVGQSEQRTKKVEDNRNPAFGETFHFLVDKLDREITFEVFETSERKKIGHVVVNTNDLLEAPVMEIDSPLQFEGRAKDATIRTHVLMRLLQEPQEADERSESPEDVDITDDEMDVEVEKAAEGLRALDKDKKKVTFEEEAVKPMITEVAPPPVIIDKVAVPPSAADTHEALFAMDGATQENEEKTAA